MEQGTPGLAFERPIYQLQARIRELKKSGDDSPELEADIRRLNRQLADLTRQVYDNLSPWETVQVARHKDRPHTADYLSMVFDEYVELHGDRHFGDDRALITGFAKLGNYKVLAIGHQKGRTTKDRTECYFGCAHPEGYRKALSKMKMAEKFGLPVISFIDTPGAYPGIGAEERGQSQAIAENMYEMSRLRTPVVCVVIGEGGSGGALGIGVGDRVAMMQYAYYSVISPEGCAGILWKTHKYAEQAAQALRFTSSDLLKFKVVDHVIDEPLGGAHREPHQAAARLKIYLQKTIRELVGIEIDSLLQSRYEKFRRMGVFLESPPANSSVRPPHLETASGSASDAADAVAQTAAAGPDSGEANR
jgi:acetyl-CoA carboxylase carboxyl transferase subunit alpha